VSISVAVDYLGASTAVGIGEERWVSIVVRPKTVDSDPRTDELGNEVNFVTTETGEVIVVSGTIGGGIPDVGALGIRLADFLISYGTVVLNTVDTGAREASVTRLRGGAESNAKGYSLFWESQRNTDTVGTLRAYLSSGDVGPAGIVLTLGAVWSVSSQKWYGTAGTIPMALKFCSNGFLFTVRTTAPENGWVDQADGSWNDVANPGNTDSMLMSKDGLKLFGLAKSALIKSSGTMTATGGVVGVDESSVTVPISIMGYSGVAGIGGVPEMSCAVAFPRPFAEAPGSVVVHDTDYGPGLGAVGTGPDYDANVDPDTGITWLLTKWGVICIVNPTEASTLTWYNRVITVRSAPPT